MRLVLFCTLLCFCWPSLRLWGQEYGKATVYNNAFHGSLTASGELYDTLALTAAHPSLPFGSLVRVTNIETRRSAELRVNDRGAFLNGEALNISLAAAKVLGIRRSAQVRFTVQTMSPEGPVADRPAAERLAPLGEKPAPSRPASNTAPSGGKSQPAGSSGKPRKSISTPPPARSIVPKPSTMPNLYEGVSAKGAAGLLYKIDMVATVGGFGVQVGTYSDWNAAFSAAQRYERQFFDDIYILPSGQGQYKVALGHFDSQASAAAYAKALEKKQINGFVQAYGSDWQRLRLKGIEGTGYHGVQVGLYSQFDSAQAAIGELKKKHLQNFLLLVGPEGKDFRLILGPFPDAETAQGYQSGLKGKGIAGFVVALP